MQDSSKKDLQGARSSRGGGGTVPATYVEICYKRQTTERRKDWRLLGQVKAQCPIKERGVSPVGGTSLHYEQLQEERRGSTARHEQRDLQLRKILHKENLRVVTLALGA